LRLMPCAAAECLQRSRRAREWMISMRTRRSSLTTGLGVQAARVLPSDKLLEECLLLLFVHPGVKTCSLVLSVVRRTVTAGRLVAAGSLSWTRRFRRLLLLRCRTSQSSCLFCLANLLGTRSCGNSRELLFPACRDRPAWRGTVWAGPRERSPTVLCGYLTRHYCGNAGQSGNRASSNSSHYHPPRRLPLVHVT
jgi:hypothetical protein